MTTTVEHATTVFEITDLPPDASEFRWCFTCTCGHTYGEGLVGLSTRRLMESAAKQHSRNPTAVTAHALMRRMRAGELTGSEEMALAQALLCASEIVDGTPIAHDGRIMSISAETAVDGLVKLLRGGVKAHATPPSPEWRDR